MKQLSSPLPVSEPGDRIMLDPSIIQPENVFDLAMYKELLRQAKRLIEEHHRLHRAIHSYPEKERSETYERRQFGVVWDRRRSLEREYRRRLPIRMLAQCPYCGVRILQPVDTFSLMGFSSSLNATKAYHGDVDWRESSPPRQRCPHALCATLSVNLNGLQPDDLSGWMLWEKLGYVHIHSAPSVIVWPLIARYTSAVMHALPIGRLDDEESIHRYTAYFATYFADDETNLHTEEMWVAGDWGLPATGAVRGDRDLVKWVKAGRLFWLNPKDSGQLVRGPVEDFPYASVEPKGWYYILKGGRLDGPNPYYSIWQGEAPPHDKSFPKTIEYD